MNVHIRRVLFCIGVLLATFCLVLMRELGWIWSPVGILAGGLLVYYTKR